MILRGFGCPLWRISLNSAVMGVPRLGVNARLLDPVGNTKVGEFILISEWGGCQNTIVFL